MVFRVFVSPKRTVLDPQGKAIGAALTSHGHTAVAEVRQGKFFDITIAPGTDGEKAAAEIEQIAHEVLANPVIEDYQIVTLE